MTRQMKKTTFLIPPFFLLMLTGCSIGNIQKIYEDKLGEYILQTSNIEEDVSYKQYKELEAQGRLDDEHRYNELGEYQDFNADRNAAGNSEVKDEQKQVHVTFAVNSYLDVRYYYDENLEVPLETNECYLNPGESIYAPQPDPENPYMNYYTFSEFRIYEYDSAGNRKINDAMTDALDTVLTIPEDFTGTELSVEPVGRYERREIIFEAYIIDGNGKHITAAGGQWTVNGEKCIEDRKKINPGEAVKVQYHYDQEEYYLVDSEPQRYSDSNGVVDFPKKTVMDGVNAYSVQLSPYCSASLEGDSDGIKKINSIKVNGEERFEDYPVKENKIRKLKTGDKVLIELEGEYRLYSLQVELNEETPGNDMHRYSFTVPDSNEEIRLYVGRSEVEISVAANVGNEITFDIAAGSDTQRNLAYIKQSFNRPYTIFDGIVGLEENIVISAKGGALPEGYALRFNITRKDGNGNTTEEISYITALPDSQTIQIYKDGLVDNFSRIYKSITVKIQLVETMVYRQETIEHGTITVRYSEEEIPLKDGDIVEADRDVEVVIEPQQGYYVSGKKVTGDSYQEEMTFEEYCSDIAGIMETHPVKKFIRILFNTADDYGDCVYKVEGEVVSGEGIIEKADLKEGETITLEYTLTDTEYQIVRESNGILDDVINWGTDLISKNKISVKIDISEELDGSTITRESCITLEKK